MLNHEIEFERVAEAAMRIERGRAQNVGNIVTFLSRSEKAQNLVLQLSP